MIAYGLLKKAGLVYFHSFHEAVYGFRTVHGGEDWVYIVNVVEREKESEGELIEDLRCHCVDQSAVKYVHLVNCNRHCNIIVIPMV